MEWPVHGLDPGTHDLHVRKWLDEHLRVDDVFLDVGANVGIFSSQAAAKGCRVIAIEPNPDACIDLADALPGPKHVVICGAAWYRSELLKLTLPVLSGQVEVRAEPPVARELDCAVDVVSHPLHTVGFAVDTIFLHTELPRPTVVKMDIQGAEGSVLDGAIDTMLRCRVAILEYYEPLALSYGDTAEYIPKMMAAFGFTEKARVDHDILFVRES